MSFKRIKARAKKGAKKEIGKIDDFALLQSLQSSVDHVNTRLVAHKVRLVVDSIEGEFSQKPTIRIKSPNRFQTQRQSGYDKYVQAVTRTHKDIDLVRDQSYAAIEDEVLFILLRRFEIVTIKEKGSTWARKYQKQAISIILNHATSGKVYDFVVNESDFNRHLRNQLAIENIGGTPKQYHKIVNGILFNAVRRLFEELDLEYYSKHLSGNMRVRFEP